MNIDLTPEELARALRLIQAAGNMADRIDATIHAKLSRAVENFRPTLPPDEPKMAAMKWRAPI